MKIYAFFLICLLLLSLASLTAFAFNFASALNVSVLITGSFEAITLWLVYRWVTRVSDNLGLL